MSALDAAALSLAQRKAKLRKKVVVVCVLFLGPAFYGLLRNWDLRHSDPGNFIALTLFASLFSVVPIVFVLRAYVVAMRRIEAQPGA